MKFTRTRDALDNIVYIGESGTHRYRIKRIEGRGWRGWWTLEIWTLEAIGTLDPVMVAGKQVGTDWIDSLIGAKEQAEKHAEENAPKGEIVATKNTKRTETVEVDSSLADALGDAPEVDPLVAAVEQAQANIDRAVSLAEAENTEGLAELAKEHEDLVSSMPQRGKIPTGDMTWAAFKAGSRADFRKASQAQPKAEQAPKASSKAARSAELEAKAKADAEAADYTTVEGVAERVDAAINLIADGVRLHVKTAQTARQAAETFLAGQRLILTEDGLPDLKCTMPKSVAARKAMYEGARAVLAKEGDPEHAKALVDKFRTSVQNQTSDVLVGMVRALDDTPEEFEAHFAKIKELRPDLADASPSEAVFEFYDIPKLSKRELMNQRNAAKAAKLAELEAAADKGDEQAAEQVAEIKAETTQEKIVGDVKRAEDAIKAAIKAAKALDETDRAALKAKIAELALLAAEL